MKIRDQKFAKLTTDKLPLRGRRLERVLLESSLHLLSPSIYL